MVSYNERPTVKERSVYDKVAVYVDGKLSAPSKVTEACKVQEGYSYMADYVLDESGNLREIRYDRVKDEF